MAARRQAKTYEVTRRTADYSRRFLAGRLFRGSGVTVGIECNVKARDIEPNDELFS